MRLAYLLCLFTFAFAPLRAQDPDVYVFFQPTVQYLYDNPSPVEYNESGRENSPLLGMLITDKVGRQPAYRTLSVNQSEFDDNESHCHELRPSFAGTDILEEDGITILYFGDTTSLRIERSRPVGASWEAAPGVRAEVISIAFGTVLESLQDSLKTIRLTDQTAVPDVSVDIIVSRSHGLVRGTFFYDLRGRGLPLDLRGLSQPKLGVQNPTLETVTDVPVGTRMSLLKRWFRRSRDDYWIETQQTSLVITGRRELSNPDRVVLDYVADILTFNGFDDPTRYEDSVLRRDVVDSTVFLASDLLMNYNGRASQPGEIVPYYLNHAYTTVCLAEDARGYGKYLDVFNALKHNSTTCYHHTSLNHTDRSPAYYIGLGGPYAASILWGNPITDDIVGFIGDTTSWGTHYDFSDVIISTRHPTNQVNFTVYPNPASSSLQLLLPASAPNYGARLLDLNGRELRRWTTVTSGQPLDVSALPTGVYLLTITEAGRTVGRRRVVIRR